jgi:hypothetical protein
MAFDPYQFPLKPDLAKSLKARVPLKEVVDPANASAYPECYNKIDCVIQSLAAVGKISPKTQALGYAQLRKNMDIGSTGLSEAEILHYIKTQLERDPVKSAKIVSKQYMILGKNPKKRSDLMLDLRLLKPNHATLLGVQWTSTGSSHILLIGRLADDNFVIYDPQTTEIYLHFDGVMNYFKKDNKIKTVMLFGTPLSLSNKENELDSLGELFTDLTLRVKRKKDSVSPSTNKKKTKHRGGKRTHKKKKNHKQATRKQRR